MLPTAALTQLAYYAGQVAGVKAHYPAVSSVAPPCLVLFWQETEITEMSEQYWMMSVLGQLLIARKGNTSGEIKDADALITPIVDAFSPNASDRSAYHLQTTTGRVDYCRVESVTPSIGITYAGHEHYGAEINWGIKLRRFTGDA